MRFSPGCCRCRFADCLTLCPGWDWGTQVCLSFPTGSPGFVNVGAGPYTLTEAASRQWSVLLGTFPTNYTTIRLYCLNGAPVIELQHWSNGGGGGTPSPTIRRAGYGFAPYSLETTGTVDCDSRTALFVGYGSTMDFFESCPGGCTTVALNQCDCPTFEALIADGPC